PRISNAGTLPGVVPAPSFALSKLYNSTNKNKELSFSFVVHHFISFCLVVKINRSLTQGNRIKKRGGKMGNGGKPCQSSDHLRVWRRVLGIWRTRAWWGGVRTS